VGKYVTTFNAKPSKTVKHIQIFSGYVPLNRFSVLLTFIEI